MKIVSVILARGGSKGIPHKNIHSVNGKPLIQYSIETSLRSNVHETWVSTNDNMIANISKNLGANILLRPDDLATDTSKSEDAILHFIDNVHSDIVVFIQPTSPLLKYEYINQGLDMLNIYDSVFSAHKQHWIPNWSINIQPIDWDINNRPRRQDMQDVYIENGAFYISKTKNVYQSKLRYSGNIGIVEMKPSEGFQIDTYDDINLISKLL